MGHVWKAGKRQAHGPKPGLAKTPGMKEHQASKAKRKSGPPGREVTGDVKPGGIKKKSTGKQAKSGPKTTYGPPKGRGIKVADAGGKKAPSSTAAIVAMINADKTLSASAKKGMIKSVRQHRGKQEAEG